MFFLSHKLSGNDEGQFLQVEVDIDGQKLRFVSLYAPIRNPARNTFFASVPDFVDLAYPTFVCGDFNAVLDPDLDRKRRSSLAKVRFERIAALHSLLAATQTFPVWHTRHPTDVVYSWDHASGEFSYCIDMIWAPTLLAKSIGDCAYHPSFFSDHCYILLTFSTGDIFERGPGVWKFNTSLLEEANYLSLVRSFWSFSKRLLCFFLSRRLLCFFPLHWIGGTRGNFICAKSPVAMLVIVRPSSLERSFNCLSV